MAALLKAILIVSGSLFVACWAAVFIASVMLRFCFDEDKMKWDACGSRGLIVSQFWRTPDVFTPAGDQLLKIRYLALKVLTATVAATIMVAVTASIAGVKLE